MKKKLELLRKELFEVLYWSTREDDEVSAKEKQSVKKQILKELKKCEEHCDFEELMCDYGFTPPEANDTMFNILMSFYR